MKKRLEEYERNLSTKISGISAETLLNHKTPKVPPSTFDLMVKRVAEVSGAKKANDMLNRNPHLHYFNIRSNWAKDVSELYEPDSKTIAILKNSLRRYPFYLGCLQKIDELFYSHKET